MANIQTAPGWSKATLDLTNPTDQAAVNELENALKNIGLYGGNVGDPAQGNLGLMYAVAAFQQAWGYGNASPAITSDMWYGLLYTNDFVVNRKPLDIGVWNSLAGARQLGYSVVDPNSFSAAPAGAIGVLPGTTQQQGAQPATPPPAPATPTTTGANMTDAFASADSFLTSIGLGAGSEFDLRSWAHQQITSPTFNEDVFAQQLQQTDQYQQRFGQVNQQRLAKGLPAMTPAEMLQYEATATGIASSSGAPRAFYDNWRDWQTAIANGWSLKEVQDRADVVSQWVYNLPPEVRQVADTWFGTGAGDSALWSYAWDPERALPTLQHQLTMSEIGGAAQRMNIGIDRQTADTLAGLGVDYRQAQQGFSQLDQARGLFDETVGEQRDLTIQGEGVAAAFGTAPGAQAVLEQRRAARGASVQGGGQFERSQRGITGLATVG